MVNISAPSTAFDEINDRLIMRNMFQFIVPVPWLTRDSRSVSAGEEGEEEGHAGAGARRSSTRHPGPRALRE